MLKKSTLIVLLIFLMPSTLFANENIKTGYDLYRNLKLLDNMQGTDEVAIIPGFYALGLLVGIFDGLVIMEQMQYNKMFPSNMMTEPERIKISKKMKFYQLNIPKEGIATGLLVLIYKKYAEKYPEKLSGAARICVFESLIKAYGWK